MDQPFLLAVLVVTASLAASALGIGVLARLTGIRTRVARSVAYAEPTVFLFDGDRLQDATTPARTLLDRLSGPGSDRERLMAFLAARLPTASIRPGGEWSRSGQPLRSPDGTFEAVIDRQDGLDCVRLSDLSAEGQHVLVDALSYGAQQRELALLRETANLVPVPLWREDAAGQPVWANERYLAVAAGAPVDAGWPVAAIFGRGQSADGVAAAPTRLRVGGDWYDIKRQASNDGQIGIGLPAGALVRAEASLNEFLQTLTRTFADLPIGLAVFDRSRQLVLFNPALVDLTGLEFEFLAGRPTFQTFLDRLREARILPEPKDYAAWRQRLLDLERAAASGQYAENWPIANGQTFRVTGRPHPEGAIAFLIEDITAETSLTRRFRAEIELAQSTLDAMDEAVCLFARDGTLVLSNQAFADLWRIDPRTALVTLTIADACRHWRGETQASNVWLRLAEFISEAGPRQAWSGRVADDAGRTIECRIAPAAAGGTLVRFALGADRPAVHRARRPRERTGDQRMARPSI
jgi:PAS domain-containing protein